MELSEKFKKYYWIALICLISVLLLLMYKGILPKDEKIFFILFILWIILLLFPLFSEINILGLKVKKEIQSLKDQVDMRFTEIKTEIRTQVQQQVYIGYGTPPPDNKIPELEEKIRVLEIKYDKTHKKKERTELVLGFQLNQNLGLAGRFSVPETTSNLFTIRFTFEKLIAQIWESEIYQIDEQPNKYISPGMMLQHIHSAGLIETDFYNLTREILSICNYAVHNRDVTDKQINFVLKNARVVYDSLYELSNL